MHTFLRPLIYFLISNQTSAIFIRILLYIGIAASILLRFDSEDALLSLDIVPEKTIAYVWSERLQMNVAPIPTSVPYASPTPIPRHILNLFPTAPPPQLALSKGDVLSSSASSILQTQPASSTAELKDIDGPEITIISPTDAREYGAYERVNIHVQAEDPSGVKQVEFYLRDELLCRDRDPIYRCEFVIPNQKGGVEYRVYVISHDTVGNVSAEFVTIVSR